ncbi:hypothetical protein [Rhizobium sp. ICMP 5592]|uniref:hypothetical protein n=1 Tax=Rhizobium sp. ICMP 5592 TaxID=2292445 RepID=UPI0025700D03|nr:hypothetical protein [Rhizobium sp. ICMP 5592]
MTDLTGDDTMQMPERAKRMGANINTVVGILSIVSSVGMGVWVTANKSRDIEDLQNWKKDFIIQNEATGVRVDERLKSLEGKQSLADGDIKTLGFRMSASEQSVGSVLASIKDLTSSVNELNGDVKVVREILVRQDRQDRQIPSLR